MCSRAGSHSTMRVMARCGSRQDRASTSRLGPGVASWRTAMIWRCSRSSFRRIFRPRRSRRCSTTRLLSRQAANRVTTKTVMTNPWPALPFEAWKDTCATLHMWTQIVGKIRLGQTPWGNHSWDVPLYLTARGLTTSPIRYDPRVFQIDFDFIDHRLLIQTGDGPVKSMALQPRSVADFYQSVFATLAELDIDVKINTTPNEVADAIPFERDQQHRSYDAEYANRFWRALLQPDPGLKEFRAPFKGKC